jgi:hypothetical protein
MVVWWYRLMYDGLVFYGSVVVPRSLTAVKKIGSTNPCNIYGGNRPSKLYAKTKAGKFLLVCLLTWQMVVVIGIKIPGIQFQDQNTEQ